MKIFGIGEKQPAFEQRRVDERANSILKSINNYFEQMGIDAYLFFDVQRTKEGSSDRVNIAIVENGERHDFAVYTSTSHAAVSTYIRGFRDAVSLFSGDYNFRPMNMISYSLQRKPITERKK